MLHLSDLHLLPRQRAKRTWVHSLASLDPDLVITTGDNIAAPDAVPSLLDAYERLLGHARASSSSGPTTTSPRS